MAVKTTRRFDDKPAVRESVPLLVGLMGPSGGGKTYSALELATGVQSVVGGEIYVIDTEARRSLHYAEQFQFRHVQFDAPFGPLDYLAAIEYCASKGAGVIVIDSMSHEHEGPGGVLDCHEKECDRLAGNDWQKRDRVKMLAWQKPKGERRRLINSLLQMNCNFIFCFRAKETAKPIRGANGKQEVQGLGFMPIAGQEFVFEMTANALLLPNANGIPTWRSDELGEKMMMKLPSQFRGILDDGKPLSRSHGRRLAEWARGGVKPQAPPVAADIDLHAVGRERAAEGQAALRAWWEALDQKSRATVKPILDGELKTIAADADRARESSQSGFLDGVDTAGL